MLTEVVVGLLLAAGIYFLLVFAAGFVLGVIRTAWVAPRLGEQLAVLMETPPMLVASWAGAKLALIWMPLGPVRDRIIMGGAALALMVIAELSLVRPLRRMSIGDYFRSRRLLAATCYLLALGVFSAMPLLA